MFPYVIQFIIFFLNTIVNAIKLRQNSKYNENQKIYFFSLNDFNKLFNPAFIRLAFTKLQTLKRIDIYDDEINIEEEEEKRDRVIKYFFFDAFRDWNKCNNIKFDSFDIDRIFD